ncbi:hypothetical protein GPECTOR_513g484 [Gonium pectorale]|uniref:5'-Nucleotidase C-terminal domain-containing protein n=1 Tax=Gonium pectorale TaxID=33097 RepID=A0A150FVZ6_GONPE|nr:hypothetical protein GPECTOR_513g484 [Gonium pectorale]|eukprot:KXZ41375.1 hypothetical protein GPECTOR_513g484 [Gonium pectorale]
MSRLSMATARWLVVSLAVLVSSVSAEQVPGGRPLAKDFGRSDEVIGRTDTLLSAARPAIRVGEAALGNMVCDGLRWFLSNSTSLRSDLCMINSGAIRANLAGDITPANVTAALPYGNYVVLLRVTGAQILAALENSVSSPNWTDPEGRFAQVSGIAFSYNASAPIGSRLLNVSLRTPSGPAPLDPCAPYALLTNDFMAGGGDGYSGLAAAARLLAAGPLVNASVVAYVAAHSPLAAGLDGRITACQAAGDAGCPAARDVPAAPEAAGDAGCPAARDVPAAPEVCPITRDTVIGRTDTLLSAARPAIRVGEVALGNMVCDGLRWFLSNSTSLRSDLCMINSGAIRGNLTGDITPANVTAALPYGNNIVLLRVTGAQVLAALENSVSSPNWTDPEGRFAQVSGIAFSYNASAPIGSRLLNVSLRTPSGPAPLDPCAPYALLTNDFMAGGGDGYSGLAAAARLLAAGPLVNASVVAYVAAHSPLAAGLDGRITACQAAGDAGCPAARDVPAAPEVCPITRDTVIGETAAQRPPPLMCDLRRPPGQ